MAQMKPIGKGRRPTNIILDLDNTLISSVALEDRREIPGLKYHIMPNNYQIFERPHVQPLLDYLFEHFNVSVWTAASKDYAVFVINNVLLQKGKKKRKLDFVFWDYHCDLSKKTFGSLKNLRMLWEIFHMPGYNASNTCLFDDLDEVTGGQRCHALPVNSFDVDENEDPAKDTYLHQLLAVLNLEKDNLHTHQGVCPIRHLTE